MLSQNLDKTDLNTLVDVARKAIREFLYEGNSPSPVLSDYSESLTTPAGCFVTLNVSGQLQGCLGTIMPNRPLVEEVHHMAIASAHRDHRFSPLTKGQLPNLTVEVSVLTAPVVYETESERALLEYLDQHKVGLILSKGYHQALFLPQVWEQLPEPEGFLKHLKRKAGWDPTYWSDGIQVKVFDVVSLEKDF